MNSRNMLCTQPKQIRELENPFKVYTVGRSQSRARQRKSSCAAKFIFAKNEGAFQKFQKFHVGKLVERKFSRIKFQNFRTISQGCPNFHSIRLFLLGPSFCKPGCSTGTEFSGCSSGDVMVWIGENTVPFATWNTQNFKPEFVNGKCPGPLQIKCGTDGGGWRMRKGGWESKF